jgi:hypothetical protein
VGSITKWPQAALALAAALLVLWPASVRAAAILQIRVVEGEGAVYAAGSRATRGITVQVTDETGRPVEGAAVSFRLPESGPGGTFSGGLTSEISVTGADGRASIFGMRWNAEPGPVELRITAAKEKARAGMVTSVYISDKAAPPTGGTGRFTASHSHKKWFIVGAAIAGAALGGMAVNGRAPNAASTAGNAPPPPQIGTPTVNIGQHP